MLRLSRSHRTTAPAMATEPCEEEVTKTQNHPHGLQPRSAARATSQTKDAFAHLECVIRRLVFPQFVGDRGQQAVVGDDGLERERSEGTAGKREWTQLGFLLTVVPVFLSIKQPVPYL